MADEKKTSILAANVKILSDPENFQKYILGTKGNGQPRALYDVVRDCTGIKKKKKKHKGKKNSVPATQISFYTGLKKKKKHKNKGKNKKHWHIDG